MKPKKLQNLISSKNYPFFTSRNKKYKKKKPTGF